jgi:hypothetical protein
VLDLVDRSVGRVHSLINITLSHSVWGAKAQQKVVSLISKTWGCGNRKARGWIGDSESFFSSSCSLLRRWRAGEFVSSRGCGGAADPDPCMQESHARKVLSCMWKTLSLEQRSSRPQTERTFQPPLTPRTELLSSASPFSGPILCRDTVAPQIPVPSDPTCVYKLHHPAAYSLRRYKPPYHALPHQHLLAVIPVVARLPDLRRKH